MHAIVNPPDGRPLGFLMARRLNVLKFVICSSFVEENSISKIISEFVMRS